MDYLSTLRNIRRILFTGFLINVAIVTVCWLFVQNDLMRYFLWVMPSWGFEPLNEVVLFLISILHIAGIVLLLVPTIALSIEIARAKKVK